MGSNARTLAASCGSVNAAVENWLTGIGARCESV
jgi:hypothetical protein